MNYTVIGAARSGLAAALLAKQLGHNVFLTESKPRESYEENYRKLKLTGISSEFGGNTEKALENCDMIIASPGVPPGAWIIREAEARGLPVIAEIEFARSHCPKNPMIAITGTNGKTTVTSLIEHIFKKSGRKALSCGNIGAPLSAKVPGLESDTVIVAETSSYQLDRIKEFRPDVAIVLNITPDHIEYHGSMEKYIEAKFKIFAKQREKNLVILNYDDEAARAGGKLTNAETAYFSASPVGWGIYEKGGRIYMKYRPGFKGEKQQQQEEELMKTSELSLPGLHNVYNSMAAALAARAFEIRNEDIRDSLMSFLGVEHRLEFVREYKGSDYINDSKATNINAAWYALSSYARPIVWIAGGRGDSNDYSLLRGVVKDRVKCIVSMGEESNSIFNYFSSFARCVKAEGLEDAVYQAESFAESGDIVLFAPACKSFDMFMNYEHRGESFKEIVNNLGK